VPAAAVIPAPVAYIKVVAVKKLVVGFLVWTPRPAGVSRASAGSRLAIRPSSSAVPFIGPRFVRLGHLL